MSTAPTELTVRPVGGSSIFTEDGFSATMKICEALVKSGILPRGVDSPYKAFAIVQKGREIGVGPMRALTGIHLIEGKPVVSPELKLEQFRERGGRVKWINSDNVRAELWLKAPNGDEHTEVVTMADMQQAGVAGKDNWRKYPKSMLRARCVGFGLRALGEGDGSYTPDELGAVTDEAGNVTYEPPVDPAYKATIQDSRPGSVVPPPPPVSPAQAGSTSLPKAQTAVTSSATSAAAGTGTSATPATAPTSGPKPVGTGANAIAHDGDLASKKQVDTMHALRSKIPTLAASPDHALSVWRKTIGVYRRQDGTRCEHCNELSKAQASHLIGRMMEKAGKLEASEVEIRSGTTGEVVPAKEPANFDNPANWLEYIHGLFPTASEEDAYFADFHAAGGYPSAEEVPEGSRQIVGLLIASLKLGPSEYKKVWNNARSLGHLPGFQP